MEEDYSKLTPEERLDRIAEILVRWIYRAEADRLQQKTADSAITQISILPKECSVSEAARKTGIPRRTLQRWIKKGALQVKRSANGYPRLGKDTLRQIKVLTTR